MKTTGYKRLEDFNDVAALKRIVTRLFDLLDNIDTVGDQVKADDQAYRRHVEAWVERMRKQGVTSLDGYSLVVDSEAAK